jgi:hypothetical protein
MKDGDVALLENVRFYPEEEKNDPAFAKKLVSLWLTASLSRVVSKLKVLPLNRPPTRTCS